MNQFFYPAAAVESAPSNSRASPQIRPKVNSVIVVPSHDGKEGKEKLRCGDDVFSSESDEDQMNPNPLMEVNSDQWSTEDDVEIEMMGSVTALYKVDEIMAFEDLKLNKADEDDIDLLLQEIYPEYRPVFPLAQLVQGAHV